MTAKPAKKLAVLACMDARLDPARLLDLNQGDAHVIRNAGGVVTDDAIRSLAISQHLLGTEEIVVIQHTDCGMQKAGDDEITRLLAQHAGQWPPFKPQTFTNLERNVRETVRALEESPFLLRRDRVRGFVYDVETGSLTEVV
ncbi:MAG TPA: carbonic anhydrase [Thermoleophilaceae bacterium]|nr:carbonic anhydrase [Thermoleophilaceae bacterium]